MLFEEPNLIYFTSSLIDNIETFHNILCWKGKSKNNINRHRHLFPKQVQFCAEYLRPFLGIIMSKNMHASINRILQKIQKNKQTCFGRI